MGVKSNTRAVSLRSFVNTISYFDLGQIEDAHRK